MRRSKNILIISTEPTPYKVDLYNAIATVSSLHVYVMYVRSKDWHLDAGHNYRDQPESQFSYSLHAGKGFMGKIKASIDVAFHIVLNRPKCVLVCGSIGGPYLMAMIVSWAIRVPFALWVDVFPNDAVYRNYLVRIARVVFQRFLFRCAKGVLVCGRIGMQSALKSGCKISKLFDFPYVVSGDRLRMQAATFMLSQDLIPPKDQLSVFFSGRLIERKGLQTLLKAAKNLLTEGVKFCLLIEGDGPLRSAYEQMAMELQMSEYTRFLGFRQMAEHSSLLIASDIVVVPSLQDNWGIVVHEGMLMGKAVCASDETGSAIDRIIDGYNGLIFPAGSVYHLSDCLRRLIHDQELRRRIGTVASVTAEQYSPERNARTLEMVFCASAL